MATYDSRNLREARVEVRKLLDATPIATARYDELEAQYDALHAEEQKMIIGQIADADQDYRRFNEEISSLMAEIRRDQDRIAKVAKVIQRVAKVVELAGKVASKLA